MENNLVYNKQAIVEVTKEFTFDSSHQLKEYNGACARLHGHTYKLQVTLEGVVNEIGIVVDFKDLKGVVTEKILSKLDHYNLNDKYPFNTTAENMVVSMFDEMNGYVKNYSDYHRRYIKLKEIKLWETPTSFASYKGRQCEKSWEDK